MMDGLIEHTEDPRGHRDAVTADAKIGVCPKCGRDLVVKTSAKTRGSFAGCMGWPDCDVTYPLPQGRIEALEGEAAVCPDCGAPRIKVQPFRQKAYETCINPACPTNREPDVEVGVCHACAEAGRTGKLIAHKSERTGKRFIRCTNYDDCGTSYPLPQRGKLEATGEECPDCGAPMVIVTTARVRGKSGPNMDCPGREKKAAAGRGRSRGTGAKAASAKKPAAKKAATKKPAAKKTAAKKRLPSEKTITTGRATCRPFVEMLDYHHSDSDRRPPWSFGMDRR